MPLLPIKVDEQLELRGPDPALAEDIYYILQTQRHHLHPWLSWVEHASSPAHVQRLLRELAAFNQGGQRFTTFIFWKQQLAGSIGLPRINRKHYRAEIGYWLVQELQGHGIITRCCRTLLHYAFTELQLNRLVIKVPSNNTRSLNIPLQLDFQHEGTLRQHLRFNDSFIDMEVFALLREDWNPDL